MALFALTFWFDRGCGGAVWCSVYVDAVLNHMTGAGSGTGSDNSSFDGEAQSYPAVPYNSSHFHGHRDCPTKDLNIQAPIFLQLSTQNKLEAIQRWSAI